MSTADFKNELVRAAAAENWLLVAYLAVEVLYLERHSVRAWADLGRAAVGLGRRGAAVNFFRIAAANCQGDSAMQSELAGLRAQAAAMPPEPPAHAGPRYLVIRDWGEGFWSDVDHVITQLRVAHATGRVPVVYWGETSRFFPDRFTGNAWEEYFEPVSSVPMSQVISEAPGLSIAPRKWNAGNLAGPVCNRWSGEGSRFSSILALGCPENIVVADFHTSVPMVQMWVAPETPIMKVPTYALIRQYLRPRQRIRDEIEAIRASWGPGPVVALHLRGTDKLAEQPNLPKVNAEMTNHAVRRADELGARIFLITDSSEIQAELSCRLGGRLLTTDATRGEGSEGLHKRSGYDVRRLAIDVMVDTYLAACCDEFFGCTASNVACMVAQMRSDHSGGVTMRGDIPMYLRPNAFSMTCGRTS